VENSVSAFNYIAINYKKIENELSGVLEQGKIDISPLISVNYTLD
jgi:hypothetical protein